MATCLKHGSFFNTYCWTQHTVFANYFLFNDQVQLMHEISNTQTHTNTQTQTAIVCESLAAQFSSTTTATAAYIHTGLNYKPYNPIGTSLDL